METITLHARYRDRSSKSSIKQMRRQGMLPAVVYGKSVDNVLIRVPAKNFQEIVAKHSIGGTLISLEIDADEQKDKKSYLVMVRELQREPVKYENLHVDFLQVSLDEELETSIPVYLIGEAQGVKEGGILQHMLREITVSALPINLPERIEADISELNLDEELRVGDLQVPSGVKVLDDPESAIVLVVRPTLEVEEEVEEEAEGEETAPEAGSE